MNTPVISIRNVIVQLVRGPLYQEDSDLWSRLLRDQDKVKLHFHMMGLDLVLDEDAGYAFLRNESGGDEDEDEETESEAESSLPRLMRRNALSFLPTVLLLELRERLLRHDQSADGTDHLYLDFQEIREFMQLYCDETGNEKKIEAKVRAAIARLSELSVLRSVTNRSDVIYRVEPILRAKLPVDQIEAIRDRLKAQLGRDDVADENQEQEEITEE
ncbi:MULTISPECIES: DUF4194 domain-containing protein [unclassified Lentimonas]|uniref:DUF4194 domain-containing protein n=1 Tax=unclassified Lentimonas TaxID=2630993 RepID=UPI0013221ADA|nr:MULTISPECIES: DUF4194 domain-containing protein [unclassified Lentimonas]CAA6677379.1 Unannotated [Lentimonas sp. CC4]CAA6686924.1 Unannotated [Lentimonas sp. CC6]CAA6690107.1 Unannotated [Lentimonas sp. CC19]CAA6690931.1 Unannotated [Lentimonas sp. CC10]CAA7070717.1 Unannotated [Lentimonas sp. CC11]